MKHRAFHVASLAAVLGLVAAFFLLQRSAPSRLAIRDGAQEEAVEPTALLPELSARTEVAVDPQEIQRLRDATRDLSKLRNEVSQLRREMAEVQRLSQENDALQSRQLSIPSPPLFALFTGQEVLARESWIDAGLGTPAATVQTYLWAGSQGNLQRAAECVDPALVAHLADHQDRLYQLVPDIRAMTAFSIGRSLTNSSHSALVHVQTYLGTDTVSFDLPLIWSGDDWRITVSP